MARVFVSHASADLVAAVDLRTWIRDAGHDVFLDRDLAEGLQVGEEWKRRLYRELRGADAVVCVVTDAYRASEWCSAEVGIADVLGCPLLPVRAAAGATSALFDGLQYADLHADPDRARAALVHRIGQIDAHGGRGWTDGRSPYPGLKAFEADMARVFRGRSMETRQLVRQLRSLGERASGGLMVIVGPSGCGKSSLLRAGLVPAMGNERGWDVALPFTPGTDPLHALARSLAATASRAGMPWLPSETLTRLEDPNGLLGVAGDLLVRGSDTSHDRLLLLVDQGEEIFTRASPERRARFARLLVDGLTGPVRVVIALRSEFVDQLRALPELGDTDLELFPLRPLGPAMLRTVIEEPADVAGLRIDSELVDRLVADTNSGEALPLLAFSLAELARHRCRGDELSASDYVEMGGVQGALARHADRALARASEVSGLSPDQVVGALTRLATLDASGSVGRRRLAAGGLEPPLLAGLEVFVDARLLMITTEPGGPWIEVTHEALLNQWPPLADAIEGQREGLRELRALESAAAQWDEAGSSTAYLWDADRLTAAQLALGLGTDLGIGDAAPLRRHQALEATSRRFVAASIHQVLRARGHRRRRRITTVTMLSVLLVISLLLGGWAVIQARSEQQQATDAQRALVARELVTRADAWRTTNHTLALQLALQARALDPDSDAALASLLETLQAPHAVGGLLAGHTKGLNALDFSPDGTKLASGADDRTVRVWDLTDPHPPMASAELVGHEHAVATVVFSPDGKRLASASIDGSVRVWVLSGDGPPVQVGRPLSADISTGSTVAFSADSRLLALIDDGRLALWAMDGPDAPVEVPSPEIAGNGRLTALAFAPHGRALATASNDGTVRFLDMAEPTTPAPMDAPLPAGGQVDSMAFASHSPLVAVETATKLVLWDRSNPTSPEVVGLPLDSGGGLVTFSRDGRSVLVNNDDIAPKGWDLSDVRNPRPLAQGFIDREPRAVAAAVAPDSEGSMAAIGSSDGSLRIWDLGTRTTLQRLGSAFDSENGTASGAGPVESVHLSDDKTLITSGPGGAQAWRIQSFTPPQRLGPPLSQEPTGPVSYAPDADLLAVAVEPSEPSAGTVRIWHITGTGVRAAGPEPAEMTVTDEIPTGEVGGLVMSPDGRTLAVEIESVIHLWKLDNAGRARRAANIPTPSVYQAPGPLAFSPDSRTLALTFHEPGGSTDEPTGSSATSLWDVTDADHPRALATSLAADSHEHVERLAFAPNSHTIAVASQTIGSRVRHNVSLWDITDPRRPRLMGNPLSEVSDNEVGAFAFTHDGRTLAVGSSTPTGAGFIRTWDVSDPTSPRRLGLAVTTSAGPVATLAFADDDRRLVTGSIRDRTATTVTWSAAGIDHLREDVVATACALAGGMGVIDTSDEGPALALLDPCENGHD